MLPSTSVVNLLFILSNHSVVRPFLADLNVVTHA